MLALARLQDNRPDGGKIERRYYWCADHHAFHLTSQVSA